MTFGLGLKEKIGFYHVDKGKVVLQTQRRTPGVEVGRAFGLEPDLKGLASLLGRHKEAHERP